MHDHNHLADQLAPAKFVIRRRDGAFVASPGAGSSYTKKFEDAWTFATYSDAERNLCPENEDVVPIEGIFRKRYRHEPGSFFAAAAKAKEERHKGVLPAYSYMYGGSGSIARSYQFDAGTVPGCEYLENYWHLRLLIADMAKTERELLLASGLWRKP